ncbi:DNA methyltransferase [Spirochaetota bacterium]|nr:DNA methyltransferase [Spirochaetota bacterium]
MNGQHVNFETPTDVATLGQVFTPEVIVKKMLALRQRRGSVLEPAAGKGIFLEQLGEATAIGIEYDARLIPKRYKAQIKVCDFFSYPRSRKFATIIGNPPYVRYQDIRPTTKHRLNHTLFDKRTNLYLFFIEKCLDHLDSKGELIFITPRDFLKATSAKNLNARLYNEGTMTHFYDLGDNALFGPYTPNCAIWRWEKGLMRRKMQTGGYFCHHRGQLWFSTTKEASHKKITLSEYFTVKVGAVSGADHIFTHDRYGNQNFVCSQTRRTGKTRRMIYNAKKKYLSRYKTELLQRRVTKFDETNWWMWGRGYHESTSERIYVNNKTRHSNPFFMHEERAYDGSVLALFPKSDIDLEKATSRLNAINWHKLGFVCDGRYLFSQRGLQYAPLGIWL